MRKTKMQPAPPIEMPAKAPGERPLPEGEVFCILFGGMLREEGKEMWLGLEENRVVLKIGGE